MDHLKNVRVFIEEMLNMMIFGIYQKAETLHEIYSYNAVAWLGKGVKLVKYDNIIHHIKNLDSSESESFVKGLLTFI